MYPGLPSANKKIVISYNVLWLGAAVLALLIVCLRIYDHWFKLNIRLSEYLAISSFGLVTIGLIYNAISLQLNYQINKQKFEKEEQLYTETKLRLTYKTMSEWYRADMAMNAEIVRRFMKPYKETLNDITRLKNFIEVITSDDHLNERKSLPAILNYFENSALLTFDNVIDESVLKRGFKTAFLSYYNNLKEYIELEQRGNNGLNRNVFSNFVKLTHEWQMN